jgi:hypothetical protein
MMADGDYPPTQGALPVWTKVYTKPGEQTFLEITEHPEAKARTAYIWVFLAGTLSGLINSLTRFIVALIGLKQTMPQFGELPSGTSGVMGVGGLLIAICSAPLAGLFAVIGFALGAAIIHATARFFGGQGSFDKMAYAFAAVAVPFSLVSAFMIPVNAIRFAGFCTLPVLLVLSLYTLYLNIAAVKAVHRFGWGEAAAATILPAVLLTLLCGLMFLLLIRLAGPSINDVFRQIQQGLNP